MVQYSVIIPAFNEEKLLPDTLAVLRDAMRVQDCDGELIVVDNNSTDETSRIARDWGANLVFEPYNQISRARNAGLTVASGEYLVFLDADTALNPELLRTAISNLEGGKCCGGGSVLKFDRPAGSAQWAVDLWNWVSRRFGYAAGSFVYCLREGFEAVGGFSEAVYVGEEIWFSRKLKRWGGEHGMDFRVIPNAPVVTSGRKLEWHSPVQLIFQALLLVVFPIGTRFRSLCGQWYKRPEKVKGENERIED